MVVERTLREQRVCGAWGCADKAETYPAEGSGEDVPLGGPSAR